MTAISYIITADRDFALRGNHRKQQDGDFVSYIYHKTIICQTMPGNTFWANNRGWNTQSTNHAVAQYKIIFKAMGFTELEAPRK